MQNEFQTRVVTVGGRIRFSYVKVFEPGQMEKNGQKIGEPKYSVQIWIKKDDVENLKIIQGGIQEAFQKGLKEKWGGVKPVDIRNPLRDADLLPADKLEKNPAIKGHYFMSVSMNAFGKDKTPKPKPVVVGPNPAIRITDPVEFYSGCYGNISINFFPYNTLGNGVSAGLQNIQKTADGESLGGGNVAPTSDFGGTDPATDDFML
jgi:hypothetical protein